MIPSPRSTALFAAALTVLPSVLAAPQAVPRQALQLEWCQERCVRNNGCSTDDMKCMCEASQDSFLADMVQCVYQYCSGSAQYDNILTPLESACKSMGKTIPQKSLDEADQLMSFINGGSSGDSNSGSGGSESETQKPTGGSGNGADPEPTTFASVGGPGPNKGPAPTAAPTTTTLAQAPAPTDGGSNNGNNNGNNDGVAVPTTTEAGGWGPTKVVSTGGGNSLATAPSDPDVEENNTSNTSNGSNGSPFGNSGSSGDDEAAGHRHSASFAAIVLGIGAAVVMGL